MASHVLPKVKDRFDTWLNKMCGHCGMVKCIRGMIQDYFGMTFDYSIPGSLKIQIFDYVGNMRLTSSSCKG